MQRVRPSRASALRRNPSSRRDKASPAGTERNACTARLKTLAPRSIHGLPSLDDVPVAYSHEFQAQLIYELCTALVHEGLGTPAEWHKCDGNALTFSQRAVMTAIGEDCWNLLKRNVEYHLEISDLGQQDGLDTSLEAGRLFVTIECGGSGYLNIGPAVEALEAEAKGLGAAFYWTLTYTLYRVMRVYNHDDAIQYEERMREYADEEKEDEGGGANGTQYEFPDVGKALPACVRETLDQSTELQSLHARRLLRTHQDGSFGSWVQSLRRLQQIAGVRVTQSSDYLESGNYDSAPLPSLLVVFKANDAITACFDEEGQYMMEGSCEPAVGVVFSPSRPAEVQQAIRTVSRFIGFNQVLFDLIEELKEWETQHAGKHLDRAELSC